MYDSRNSEHYSRKQMLVSHILLYCLPHIQQRIFPTTLVILCTLRYGMTSPEFYCLGHFERHQKNKQRNRVGKVKKNKDKKKWSHKKENIKIKCEDEKKWKEDTREWDLRPG